MKNIWVLETDKPTKILKTIPKGNFIFAKSPIVGSNWENYHIYITYDHSIKENDFVFDTFKDSCPKIRKVTTEEEISEIQETDLKIVLTTDETLGIQKIDDEFLNWWVNNYNCEYVDLRLVCSIGRKCDNKNKSCKDATYKIIIPQEKPTLDVIAFKSEKYAIKRESVEEASEN